MILAKINPPDLIFLTYKTILEGVNLSDGLALNMSGLVIP